jgi:hypothetical protein
MNKTLSPEALKVIEQYMKLRLGAGGKTPYYNNRRGKIRGGLNAIIGKGTPEEICDEARILALRRGISLKKASPEQLAIFLVDEGLGVDCSGFAFHVLNAESKARKQGRLFSHVTLKKSLVRRILAKLRPASNVSVGILSMDENSTVVQIADAEAGDFISIIGSGLDHTYNHIMVITKIEGNVIHYAHSYAWPSDGKYNHGVNTGTITITNQEKPLLEQLWTESGVTGFQNYTYVNAQTARKISIRRLNAFS